MQPRINVLTIAVDDLKKAHAFYSDGLGLPSNGVVGTGLHDAVSGADGTIVMFELNNNLILALYPRTELAKDAGLSADSPNSTEFSMGYTVNSKEKVDELLERAKRAGATVTEPPRDRPWGIYSGYFKDLDGHLWEIIWNPGVEVAD